MEWVLSHRGITQRGWSMAAGLGERHVSVILTRARRDPGARPDHETMAALARAAKVPLGWLEDGIGMPDEGPPEPRPPMLRTPAHADPVILDSALGAAFDPTRHTVADLVSVRSVMEGVDLTALAPEALIRAAGRWLDGAAASRAMHEPVTLAGLLVRTTTS